MLDRRLLLFPILLICLAQVLRPGHAAAQPRVYEYRIQHPQYGHIGTYINSVERIGDLTNVTTTVRVAVKVFGITVYRQEADRLEQWRGDRLAMFRGITHIDGRRIEVSGDAKGDTFIITTAEGITAAPIDIRPANPWTEKFVGSSTMMSVTSGRVFRPRIVMRNETLVSTGGPVPLRRYEIESDKHETVWLDQNGVTVAFRTEEDGALIDFLLVRYPVIETVLQSDGRPPPALPIPSPPTPGRR